jgi:3-hydroxy-3-methylglutaryl CoA synthase/uncharacterized OB-fold protein
MAGIVAYGTYVPYARLQRSAITAALGVGGGRGTRAVASYDEDATSMGVEAARRALRAAPDGVRARGVVFATTAPPYLDKTNATAIHAALRLDAEAPAYDMVGSVRSGIGALRAAVDAASGGRATLAVLSDVRTGLPGGADESGGGDAAAAFLLSRDGVPLLDTLGNAASTAEFLDRWRQPGDTSSRVWEERFGEQAYVPLAEAAFTDACKQAGLTAADVDVLLVAGLHSRAAKAVARAVGARPEALADDLTASIGNPGTAQPGLLLADAMDRAEPGQVIALVTLADGAEVALFRATEALVASRSRRAPTVAAQVAAGDDSLSYASFLTWRGQLHREPPRRPDPERPAAPPAARRTEWKYGFVGSRCESCATRHLPPQRVCVRCGAQDRMAPEPLADVPATIATSTVDRLAFSLNPPVVAAVLDFDGGGRFQCELTDVDPAAVRIGDRVEMTFRRLFTADGVHNYFWKARPIREEA